MAVPVNPLAAFRVLTQITTNLLQLQRDMRNNATTWLAMANAQSPAVATLAQFMNDAATTYQTRLTWITNYQSDPNWPAVKAVYLALGGTQQDIVDQYTPMQTVANQLGPAAKNTYAQVIAICNQILAAINAPPTLWPE